MLYKAIFNWDFSDNKWSFLFPKIFIIDKDDKDRFEAIRRNAINRTSKRNVLNINSQHNYFIIQVLNV